MEIPIKIIFKSQQERYNFFQGLFGKKYHVKMNTLMDIEEGVKISIDPYTIFESEAEIPSILQFSLNLAVGYTISKLAELLYSKVKNCKINSVKIGEKEIGKSLEDIEKAIKDLEKKLQKD